MFVECGATVVQLVRTPACHAGGRRFESRRSRRLSAKRRLHHQLPRNESSGVPLRLLAPRADWEVRVIAPCGAAPGSADRPDLSRLSSAAEELVGAIGFEP